MNTRFMDGIANCVHAHAHDDDADDEDDVRTCSHADLVTATERPAR